MNSTSLAPRRAVSLPLTLALALVSLLGAFGLPAAEAAAPPAAVQPDSSSGVTSDVLPTTQISSGDYVQDQAIAGDTVYAGGSITSARPAGAAAGTNESARTNLLAYSISTGNLVSSFAPNLNGIVRVLALSPDKSRLYVGGEFTTVDGTTHNRLVAFSTATGQVDPSFAVDLGGPVYAISATSSTVYVGGQFTQANGVNRGRFAAFRASDGGLLSAWVPKVGDGQAVRALLVAPGGNVIAGGQFATIGSLSSSTLVASPGSVSLDPTTGATKAWAVNKVIKQYGANGGVLSLKTDGTTVYGAGFWFGGTDSNFEGAWAVSPSDGSIKWLADCHGDTYDTTVANGVVYAASHQHDCSNIGSFPQQRPTQVEWRANAFTASAQGDVQPNSLSPTKFSTYSSYQAPAVVNWFPQFAQGPTSGYYSGQPTLTIESTSDYVVVGGQFPTVNGKAQQGLVRFARGSIAPKKVGPRVYFSDPGSASTSVGSPTVRVVGGDTVRVTAAPWDRDDAVLSRVDLLRNGSSVWSATNLTAPWWKTTVAYTDRNVTAGTKYTYQLKMTDADGNTVYSGTASATPSGTAISSSTYVNQVKADGASSYWRLDDPSTSSSVTDWAGSTDLVRASGLSLGTTGAIGTDKAASVNGTGSASAASNSGFVRAPNTFSVEAWFKTTSTSGGQVVGFGDVPTGSSYRHDRQVYLSAGGQLVYYVDQNGTSRTVTSPRTYNNGVWHHVVATMSSSGMVLYVDGAKVASSTSVTYGRAYGGFWRVGADVLPGKTSTTSAYLSGAIDDVAVYPSALSATKVKDHYTD
ncbi:MAG: LamG domain-containing protein, partial [Janthinobacterium lividum]